MKTQTTIPKKEQRKPTQKTKQNDQAFDTIPVEIFNKSFGEQTNNLIAFLRFIFPKDKVENVQKEYQIGTSSLWDGATIYWQIDKDNKIRTGKILLYHPGTGKIEKLPAKEEIWIHKKLKGGAFTAEQCMFGEHLLSKFPGKKVCVVESEKTALIASILNPEYIWLALGSIQNLNKRTINILKNRQVYFYPDVQSFEIWQNKLLQARKSYRFYIHDLRKTIEGKTGKGNVYDPGDLIIGYPLCDMVFYQEDAKRLEKENTPNYFFECKANTIWNFFYEHNVPEKPIKINEELTIKYPYEYTENNMKILDINGNTPYGRRALYKLEILMQAIESQKKKSCLHPKKQLV